METYRPDEASKFAPIWGTFISSDTVLPADLGLIFNLYT